MRAALVGRFLGHGRERIISARILVDNLTVAYRRHPALHHVSGAFEAGSLTAVIGPNGAGKSTLLKAILGRVPVDGGRIEVSGPGSPSIAYLPQQAEIERAFPISVLDCVLLGFWPAHGAFSRLDVEARARGQAALVAVGLDGFARRGIGTLSSGQFQRMLFARLLVQDAPVILLDEPFNAIDARTTAELMRLVRQWHAEGRTVIAVLHDYALVREHFPQTLLLARRVVAWGETLAATLPERLREAGAMAQAWDETASPCEPPLAA